MHIENLPRGAFVTIGLRSGRLIEGVVSKVFDRFGDGQTLALVEFDHWTPIDAIDDWEKTYIPHTNIETVRY